MSKPLKCLIRFNLLTAALIFSTGVLAVTDEETALSPIKTVELEQLGELMRELRKIQRDDLFVPVARLQLLYYTNLIEESKNTDPERANSLRKSARGVAFNIASFTWPGWGDTGPITPEAQEMGYSAARVGLRLAQDAKDVTPNILWINGAHAIAAKEHEIALATFEQSYDLADSEIDKLMHKAWIEFSRYCALRDNESKLRYEAALSELSENEHEYAEFFASQLTTAQEIFSEQESSDHDSNSNK